MVQATLLIALSGLLSTILHRHRFGRREIKKVQLSDWISLTILPIVAYISWAFVLRNILSRQHIPIIPISDTDLLMITFIFFTIGAIGNTIHSTGKILWYHLAPNKKVVETAYTINEIFHGPLGHYLVFINILLIIFFLPIHEINHPAEHVLEPRHMRLLAVSGVILGVTIKRCFSFTSKWFGGYNRFLFFFITLLTIVTASLYHFFDMYFYLYPVTWFTVWTFASILISFSIQTVIWLIKKKKKPETLEDRVRKMPFGKSLIKAKSFLEI